MTLLARIRSRHVPLARALVALFAVGWLALALQPCHAMGQAEPAHPAHGHGGSGAGHADHAHGSSGGGKPMPAGGDTPCPHCPSDSPDDCGLGTAIDCEAIGVPAVSAQKAGVPAFDTFAWHVAPLLSVVEPGNVPLRSGWPGSSGIRPPSASLQQRYCTYLK